ncbi:MAG: fumarate reductase [Acidimicrobiia bacterium]|nr:MAG: fumarate reductase [Acidimicrobiia bacterium]
MTGEWGPEWDRVADVVVVGAGAAGATAAAVAAMAGVSVIVLEKAPVPGGTTAASRCQMWIPNNRFLADQGLTESREDTLRYMARTAYPVQYRPDHPTLGIPPDRYRMLEAFYDEAAGVIDTLVEAGIISLEPVDYPSYYAHLPEETCPVGRTLQPVLPPGHVPGRDPSGGQTLVDSLLGYAVGAGAEVLVDHRVAAVIRNEAGAVVGVEARAGLATRLIGARRGVIFTTGGFLHDPRLALDYLKGPVLGGASSPFATGDFVRIGIEAGAQLGNMAHAWWDQVVVELVALNRATRGDVYAPYGDSMLMVNRHGRRVVNEKAPYNERAQVHFEWDPHRGEYPNLLLFMIFDQAVVDRPTPAGSRSEEALFRWPVPSDERPRHYVIKAGSLEGLADELGRRLQRLEPLTGGLRLDPAFLPNLFATIERFNRFARSGVDPDFRRGETPIEQRWAGPPRPGAPSASIYPLAEQGPYYCVILGPGALDTKGGPVTDHHGRVLGVGGHPIPGLYGAGNCVASPAGQAYWGPGGTIGPAVTFGALAARHASAQVPRLP